MIDIVPDPKAAGDKWHPYYQTACALKARARQLAWIEGKRLIPVPGIPSVEQLHRREADPTRREGPTSVEVLRHQISLDMQLAIVDSPWSDGHWASCKGGSNCGHRSWRSHLRASTVMILIPISDAIVDAAVDCWSRQKKGRTPQQISEARSKLRKKFLPGGERGFLLIVRPILASDYVDEWGVKFPPMKTGVKLVPFGRPEAAGTVTRYESVLDKPLRGGSSDVSCLLFLKDTVDEERDPSYEVRIQGIKHQILLDPKDSREENFSEKVWHEALKPADAGFRFTTGKVPLLAMLEKGVPWEKIETDYLQPHRNMIAELERRPSAAGCEFSLRSFLFDLGTNLVAGILLKALPF